MKRRIFLSGFLVAGCSSAQLPLAYDLASPVQTPASKRKSATQLTLAEPKTLAALESDRMAVRETSGAISYLPKAVFADRLPRLVQTRLLHAFESSNRLASVGRVGERLASDYQLLSDIRAFYLEESTREVRIELAMKLMNDKTGRILAAQVFIHHAACPNFEPAQAAQAFDIALKNTLEAVIAWATRYI